MTDSLSRLAARLRFSDWGPGKIPVLCTVLAFIGLAGGGWGRPYVLEFVLFLVYASAHSALGYVANDLGDRRIDRAQGKANAFDGLAAAGGTLFFGALLLVALLSGLPFTGRPWFVPLWALWVISALGYSLPPLRLKERGGWGLGVSALAQWTLPVFLAFAAMGRFRGWEMFVFALAATASGSALEAAHQRHDRDRDRGTSTATLGARMGDAALDRLYAAMVLLDKAALGLVVFVIVICLPGRGAAVIDALLGWPLPAVYFVLLAASLIEAAVFRRRGGLADPYYGAGRSASTLLHQTFPNLFLPAWLLLLLALDRPACTLLLAGFLFWRLILGGADWRWPWRALICR